MKKLVAAFIFILNLGLYAGQTIHGPSGLISMPSGESLEYGKFDLAIDFKLDGSEKGSQYYKFNLGAFKNSEIGVVGGTVPTEGVFVNVKYFLLSDNERFPFSIAVGLENLGSKDNTGTYFVGTKQFEGGLSGHLGFRAIFDNRIDPSVMMGGEYVFDDRMTFLVDFTGRNRKYSLNVGMQYYLNYDVVYRLNILDVTQNLNDEFVATMGLSFSRFFM
tara:strand:- start:307 stop:960 length:654 start_codon:yes stop_codon:yes gene_type:complete